MTFFEAIQRKDLNAVEILIDMGEDVNITTEKGYTPLYSAVLAGEASIVETLIRSGANVNIRTHYGTTPLTIAARYSDDNYKTIRKILLQAGAV